MLTRLFSSALHSRGLYVSGSGLKRTLSWVEQQILIYQGPCNHGEPRGGGSLQGEATADIVGVCQKDGGF